MFDAWSLVNASVVAPMRILVRPAPTQRHETEQCPNVQNCCSDAISIYVIGRKWEWASFATDCQAPLELLYKMIPIFLLL
ncbi:hypothetical protein H4Q26_014565 [Puccinia striiformis f. sp. tritici PST-130]|nr:hypothetical protein H4Q26_014565 [Puccinia striiformis f. sp. tritici PST-130]